jgi:hypothetical protein
MKNALLSEASHTVKLDEAVQRTVNFKVNRIIFSPHPSFLLRIYAPIWEIKNWMKMWGMISSGGSPKASGVIFRYHDISILEYYKKKALCLLNYYKPVVNYSNVKKLVNYHLR